ARRRPRTHRPPRLVPPRSRPDPGGAMTGARRKIHRTGTRPDLRVPFTQVALGDSPDGSPNAPVLLYDTSGPGADPNQGLPALRAPWIEERGDTVEIEGRAAQARDGRRAAPHGRRSDTFTGRRHPRRRARDGAVTQLVYARRGQVTPEMEFVAIREGVEPELVRAEVARGRAIIPANVNH